MARIKAVAKKRRLPKNLDSTAEESYYHLLTIKANAGEIRNFYLKPGALRLGDIHYYPDFLVIQNDGELQYHEVKSHHRYAAKGIAKLKMVAGHYTDLTFVLVMVTGKSNAPQFEYTEIET